MGDWRRSCKSHEGHEGHEGHEEGSEEAPCYEGTNEGLEGDEKGSEAPGNEGSGCDEGHEGHEGHENDEEVTSVSVMPLKGDYFWPSWHLCLDALLASGFHPLFNIM